MGVGLSSTGPEPEASPPGRLRLFVAGEGQRFATHHLPDSGEVTVGSDPACELRVDDECNRAARFHSSFALLRIACDPSCPSAAIEEILANSIRLVDVIAVGGPSEYEVMLVDTPPADLKLVVSRLETQLAEQGGKPRIGMA